MDKIKEPEKTTTSKGVLVLLVIVIMVLSASIGIMLSRMNDLKTDSAEKVEIMELLEIQKQSLENDLTDLQREFGSLQTNNDSLKTLASEQQERITKLLAVQADNAYKIRMYQKELETIRAVLKNVYVQIDSINQRNIALTKENNELAQNLKTERSQKDKLVEDKEKLTTTVQKAQILSAADIQTVGLNNKGKETPRVRNIEKLKTCFTVRENTVASAGEKVFYLVITKPDKKVLPSKNNEYFIMQEGAEIFYTDKRTIMYENADIEVCIFTDSNGRLAEGNYEVKIYCEGYLIGISTFILK